MILVLFWYEYFRKFSFPRAVLKMAKIGAKLPFWERKSPEILRFQDFLVEISGIEPLTS